MLTEVSLPPDSRAHWNYFLALESDMLRATRYVEFSLQNKDVYSVEFAQILMSAASEVDVLAKLIVGKIAPTSKPRNIDDYRAAVMAQLPAFADYGVVVPRYGLRVQPWSSWKQAGNPAWWRSYNDVKHERDAYFHQANLENALSALAGLLVTVVQYYRLKLAPQGVLEGKIHAITGMLQPSSTLLLLDGDYYALPLMFYSDK